jgi:hypothetical protein
MNINCFLFTLIVLIKFGLLNGSSSDTSNDYNPSNQLKLHQNVYKPPEFKLKYEILGRKTVLVSFNYTKIDLYDEYLFRIRYHGHEEYATSIKKMNKTHENSLKMRDMLDAGYTVCVSLYASERSNKHLPLSTTGMCVDFTIGETHPIGGSHNSTGLLAPLLLAVAAVILVFIAVVTYFKEKKVIQLITRRAERLKFVRQAQDILHIKRDSEKFSSFVAIDLDSKEKSVQWQSFPSTMDDLSSKGFLNPAFISDETSESTSKDYYDHEGALSSIKTLSHLLDDKPWILRTSATPRFLNKNLPKGFY